jgi:N-dimethylarginine dimethylaminohydrolase
MSEIKAEIEYGGQTMVAPIRRILVKRPDRAFAVENPERWNYTGRPDLASAQREHDELVKLLKRSGAEVVAHDEVQADRADAIYVFDPALITNRGAVILCMGKDLRRGEEAAMKRRLEALGIPTIFAIEGSGRAEGGDMFWLDERTLAVGIGFRTNREALRQLRDGLAPMDIEIVPVELPYYTGPRACLHLLSLISMVDRDLAVAYPPLLSVPFWQELQDRDIEIVEVPAAEFASMGPNVLALAPRECLMLEGNPVTKQRLEATGCSVTTYTGNEISLKAEGGPTCLTRPLLRRV